MKQLTVFECPICGRQCGNQNDLRTHMQVTHRKSQIVDGYLDAVGE